MADPREEQAKADFLQVATTPVAKTLADAFEGGINNLIDKKESIEKALETLLKGPYHQNQIELQKAKGQDAQVEQNKDQAKDVDSNTRQMKR